MPTERLSMRRIRDLLRLKHENGLSSRVIAASLGLSKGAVGDNPTLGDAILDRLIHNAHRLAMTGESMRKIAGRRSLDASRNP